MPSLASLALLAGPALASYSLHDSYMPGHFFDSGKWDFFQGGDPTHGTVNYVSESTAKSSGYISDETGSSVYIGVDHNTKLSGGDNRASVRITSQATYNHGLFVLDLEHMPAGCGTWPAFWMVGPNWPSNGEIDIIEGVNNQAKNAMTLHTADGCKLTRSDAYSGTVNADNCYVDASGQAANAGCGISATNTNTYGDGFNNNNGGVYATEWTSDHIAIWMFPRGSIPSDVQSGSPDPSSWGKPLARWASSGCDIDRFIKDQQIVFDITFCGDWAGNVFDSMCGAQVNHQSCADYVRGSPNDFANAYWIVNSLKVYSQGGNNRVADVAVLPNPAEPVSERVRNSTFGVKMPLPPI